MSERREDIEYFLTLIDDAYRSIVNDPLAEDSSVINYKVESPEVKKDDLYTFNQKVEDCHSCPCFRDRKALVLSRGKKNAKIMFITSSFSREDVARGKALSGVDGQIISSWLKPINIDPSDCYFSSLKKCCSATSDEGKCKDLLMDEIDIVNPKVIILVGGECAQLVTDKVTLESLSNDYTINNIPTFLSPTPKKVRENQSLKQNLWSTLCKAKDILDRA